MASWFSEGTVTVTNGNAVVNGVGTKFSNSRAGDMFVGPDNGIYQVINPSSDTAVSISPAYRGATSAGATYGIVPVNGYPKALADAVNLMVQQWGATLAGLGPVASMTTVPVANGGTGATNAATARTNLGLGSAATRSVGVVTGNLLEVAAAPAVVGNSSFAVEGSRFISHLDGTTTGGAPGAPNAVGFRSRFADNSLWAVDIVAGVYQTAAGLYWRQVNASGVSLGWRQIYDTTNTTRAQDGTLKAI
ncbi:hypothetical protein N2A98_15140 [Pseudomonas sp. FJ2-5-13]|uniref:hypothetical protein n=1 Tax=Pseudomonas sp. FJ2-5-13 TaxID=2976884 RepID=UPI0023D8995C|nr:hypothetical protein [Pseudomonas sp. FJ2-5-13]WEJ03487.1 hypothetical protein N2A98_15140 [Pseudomonas sp. FJ2-5-13]